MQNLKREVELLGQMTSCMDSFLGNSTRLVVIVDGLDSCEQDRLLTVRCVWLMRALLVASRCPSLQYTVLVYSTLSWSTVHYPSVLYTVLVVCAALRITVPVYSTLS